MSTYFLTFSSIYLPHVSGDPKECQQYLNCSRSLCLSSSSTSYLDPSLSSLSKELTPWYLSDFSFCFNQGLSMQPHLALKPMQSSCIRRLSDTGMYWHASLPHSFFLCYLSISWVISLGSFYSPTSQHRAPSPVRPSVHYPQLSLHLEFLLNF